MHCCLGELWGRRLWLSVPYPINDDAVQPRISDLETAAESLSPISTCTGGTQSRRDQGLSQDETARLGGDERNPSIDETGNVVSEKINEGK